MSEIPDWFTKLPDRFIEEIAKHPPTCVVRGNTWHEVQFIMGDIMCQCAVVDGAYVCCLHRTEDDVKQFVSIRKIFPPMEGG